MTKPAREYAPVLLERILSCMWPRHPQPCFSGYISLETLYSLNVVKDALEVLQERKLVHRLSDEEKVGRYMRIEFDVYVLTEAGYKSSRKE